MCDQRFCPFIFWITFELLFIQLIMPQNVICEVLRVNSGGFLCRVYSIMGRHNPVMVVAVFYHAKVRKKWTIQLVKPSFYVNIVLKCVRNVLSWRYLVFFSLNEMEQRFPEWCSHEFCNSCENQNNSVVYARRHGITQMEAIGWVLYNNLVYSSFQHDYFSVPYDCYLNLLFGLGMLWWL